MNEFIKEGSLVLRAIVPEDKELFLKWHNDQNIRECIGGIFPFTERTFEYVCRMSEQDTPPHIWFALCYEEELIGVAGLHNVKYIQKNAEVAILIGNQDYRKKGFGSRYLILLEKYAFDMINLHRLYAFIYPENTVSRHLFEKHDYILEGVVREAAFWNGEYRDIMLYGKLK